MKLKNKHILLAIVLSAMMVTCQRYQYAAVSPSSSQTPYLNPIAPGVEFTSILTVGDTVKKKHKGNETYRMVGVPDGLGAYDNGDGTITVLMNHELVITEGIVRAHGAKGSFVSRWQIRKSDLKVLNGEDQMQKVKLWDPINQAYVDGSATVFSRFCSADLPAPTAFFNSKTGKGFSDGRIYMNGEEDSSRGRAMAHLVDGREHGTSYELPKMGKYSWENLVASPYPQDKTVVAGLEDGELNASRVFFYIGEKSKTGSPIDMAGLANGKTYAMVIDGYPIESDIVNPIPNGFNGHFTLVSGTGGTGLNRVEDGAWDTVNPNRFYFVTTASITGNSRLWRITFNDITNPTAGGNIEVLVNGNAVPSPQIKMMDNITVDKSGNVYMQEDVGNNVRLGQVWMYNPSSNAVTDLGQHDPIRFIAGASADIDGTDTRQSDEESSGIIDVTDLFKNVDGYDTDHNNYFLLDIQAHYTSVNGVGPDMELVQGGQLLMMKVAK